MAGGLPLRPRREIVRDWRQIDDAGATGLGIRGGSKWLWWIITLTLRRCELDDLQALTLDGQDAHPELASVSSGGNPAIAGAYGQPGLLGSAVFVVEGAAIQRFGQRGAVRRFRPGPQLVGDAVLYQQRFKVPVTLSPVYWQFVPDFIKATDNRVRFGYKERWPSQ